jgi:DNA-binding response OmpR family regulator
VSVARTILVIDDEPELVKLLDYNLTKAGYLVLSAKDGENGLAAARKHAPDAVILDVMMPGLDGWEVCKRLRQDASTSAIPLLMLTAKSEEGDRVLGLELGADDYVTKPFGTRELRARVKALLRRATAPEPDECYRFGEVEVDFRRGELRRRGAPVDLTPIEFKLMTLFVRAPGRLMSRERLIEGAWGADTFTSDRIVDNHIANLRKKIETDPADPRYLRNVRGMGYRFDG